MNLKKQLCSLARLVLPGVGFVLISLGVCLISLQTEHKKNIWRVIPAYIMIVSGLLAMLFGVFWSIYHTMKSKMYQRECTRVEHIQVYTIRPSSFPPSYEESQGRQVCTDTSPETGIVVMGLAPPLYNQDSSEAPDYTWSWEQPPRYSQVERLQLGHMNTE